MPGGSKNDGLEPALARVSRDAHRVLQIACVAERKSMTDLLRPVVEDYAARLADEPDSVSNQMLTALDCWSRGITPTYTAPATGSYRVIRARCPR
jgi:hypothetical protein